MKKPRKLVKMMKDWSKMSNELYFKNRLYISEILTSNGVPENVVDKIDDEIEKQHESLDHPFDADELISKIYDLQSDIEIKLEEHFRAVYNKLVRALEGYDKP